MTADSSWWYGEAALNVRLQIIDEIALGENPAPGQHQTGRTVQTPPMIVEEYRIRQLPSPTSFEDRF